MVEVQFETCAPEAVAIAEVDIYRLSIVANVGFGDSGNQVENKTGAHVQRFAIRRAPTLCTQIEREILQPLLLYGRGANAAQ
jgi:hypothetical protein